MSAPFLEDVLTIEQAAAATGRSSSSLVKAAQRGRLRARLIGNARGKGVYVTTLRAVAAYVAEVEAWRRNGRQPRNSRIRPPTRHA